MKFGQFVVGPAGSGKSSYCALVQEHLQVSLHRTAHVVNLDPAAEEFYYECEVDVRDLISVTDVMEELEYGPNGALVYSMEYLMENLSWLEEQLCGYQDDDYVVFDCPGQIELYVHHPAMRRIVDMLRGLGFNIAGVFCLDVTFLEDAGKMLSGMLVASSAMVSLELPHVNVLTKCDLLTGDDADGAEREADEQPEAFLSSPWLLVRSLRSTMPAKYKKLHEALAAVIEEFAPCPFVLLNRDEEDSVDACIAQVNNTIQYGEDLEPLIAEDDEAAEGDMAE